jgi:hypothetical protein
MPLAVAEMNIGVGPSSGETCGEMLEAMARIAPSHPNEAMAHIAPCRNGTISLDPSCRIKIPKRGSWDVDQILLSKVQVYSKGDWARMIQKSGSTPPVATRSHNFTLSVEEIFDGSPCSAASFEVNSGPHTGTRPSFRLCVGQIT